MWGFIETLNKISFNYKAAERKKFIEGAKKENTTTRYERNIYEREECIG